MKKSLVLMAMAGVALAGCVNDEVADVLQKEQGKTLLRFDSPVLYNNESRTIYGELGTYEHNGGFVSYPTNESFIIYAIKHPVSGGDLNAWPVTPTPCAFNGQAISYDRNVDGWVPRTSNGDYYYWSSDYKLSFAATSPADLEQGADWNEETNRTFSNKGLTIKDFTVPQVGQQYDLLYTDAILNKSITDANENTTDGTKYEGVFVKFKHALTAIHISISKDEGYKSNVILKSVTLKNVQNKGSFQSIVSEGAKYWTAEENRVDYPILANGNIFFPATDAGMHIKELDEEGKAQSLLIMPQTLTESVTLDVAYTVNGAPITKSIKLIDTDNNSETDNDVKEWQMGTKYTYHLHLSGSSESLKKIYFAPSTEGWQPGKTTVIEL